MQTGPHIIHITSSLKVGGAERVLIDLVRELQREGYRNSVVYFHDGPNRLKLEEMGITPVQISGKYHRYDPYLFYRMWKLLNVLKPDCIHSSLWAANFVARLMGKLAKIPVVNALHAQTNLAGRRQRRPGSDNEEESATRLWLDKFTRHWAQRYVLVSNRMKFPLLPTDKIRVIPNGIQPPPEEGLVTRKSLGIASDAFVIGSVGRFCVVKNFQLLLRTLKLIRGFNTKAHLVLIGYGEQEKLLRLLAHELNIQEYVHFVKTDCAHKYYTLFNCFVMTSFQEGLSIALLEAMSCAVPPILVGDSHELVENDKNGILVYAHDPVLLSMAVERLITHPALARELGKKAQELVVGQYTTQQMVSQYRKLYSEVMKNF